MSEGKVALVTGATRGIGRAVLERLLSKGRRVIACARDEKALDALVAAYPGQVWAVPADLGVVGEAVRVAQAAYALAPRIDELVYAAGIVRYASIGSVIETDLRAQLEVNFVAPFLMAQELGVRMKEQGGGAMVLVASTLGERPAKDTAAYAASKAALMQAARSLALELAPLVRVNTVAPGVVDTDMVRVLRGPVSAEGKVAALNAQLAQLADLHPLGRLGTAAEISEAIAFLLDASWITGTTLRIDGGLLAG